MTCSRERFLSDIRNHRMTIRQDDGLYRHLRFARPNTNNLSFSLITWPGYLAIAGDCHDYMFTRLPDMFDFFRYAGPDYAGTDRINCDYWAEKMCAVSRHGGTETFSEARYREAVYNDFRSHTDGMEPSDKRIVWGAVRAELLDSTPDTRTEAVERTLDFRCPVEHDNPFTEFWDYRLTEPSFGMVWALRAIQWGIKRYDLHRQGRSQADHDHEVLAGHI